MGVLRVVVVDGLLIGLVMDPVLVIVETRVDCFKHIMGCLLN